MTGDRMLGRFLVFAGDVMRVNRDLAAGLIDGKESKKRIKTLTDNAYDNLSVLIHNLVEEQGGSWHRS